MQEDPEVKAKLEEANAVLKEQDEKLKQQLDPILNPKKQRATFKQKLSKYNKPTCNVVFGTIAALGAGLVAPLFGYAIMKNLSETMFAQYYQTDVLEAIKYWIIFMLSLAIGIWIAKSSAVILFQRVG